MLITRILILTTVFLSISSYTSANAQDAFLRKGTTALNPEDRQTLFLYIPGYTLLYDLGKIKTIGSKKFGTREEYQFATTQDGIPVLVRKPDIREDVNTIRSKYDFLVNRRLPLCETEDACRNIWNKFTNVQDEGSDWVALWPRTAGVFVKSANNMTKAVSVSIGGAWENGFIPAERDRLKLEDVGFISLLDRKYPLYRFDETNSRELASPCGHERSATEGVSLLNEVEAYAKASVTAKIDAAESIAKAIPENFASVLLSFLGLEASISAEAFVDGRWKKETIQETTNHIVYGDRNEQWLVKTVNIQRRSDTDQDVYQPFG